MGQAERCKPTGWRHTEFGIKGLGEGGAVGPPAAIVSAVNDGTSVLDVRRGDGPKGAFSYTLPAVATTDCIIQNSAQTVAAVVRAVVSSHAALGNDVSLATLVGRKLLPALRLN